MKRFFAFLIIIAALFAANAQTYTLDSCINLALRNNIELKNAGLDIEASQEVKKQAFSKYFPKINAFAGGYYAINPLISYSIDDIENAEARQMLHNLYFEYGRPLGIPDQLSLCENGISMGAAAIQPLYAGGRIVNGNKLADLGIRAAELQQDLTFDKILQDVERNFWLVYSLQQKKITLDKAKTTLDTLYKDVSTAKAAGLATRNDELKVIIKQNEIKSNLLKVHNGILLAKQALCQSIGIEYDENIVFNDTLDLEKITKSLDYVDFEKATAHRKETMLLNLNVEAENLKKKMIVGEALPQVMVGVAASYGNPVFDKYSANGLAFATLNIPITDWNETSHKIKQQNLIIQKAENTRTDLTQKMKLELQQAWNDVEEAKSQLDLSKQMLIETEENLSTSIINYQSGLTTISEVLEAQTLNLQSSNQLTDSLIDLKMKVRRYNILTKSRSLIYH